MSEELERKTIPDPNHPSRRLFKPGVSGNPGGGRAGTKTRIFRIALTKFMLEVPEALKTATSIELAGHGYRVPRYKRLLTAYFDKAEELIPKCTKVTDLIAFVPLLIYIRDTMDGREESSKEQIKEASTVFLTSEGIKRKMIKTLTAKQTITTESEVDNGTDNGLRPSEAE